MVLISGPSSSGKTTFSKRLSIQLMASGMHPYPVFRWTIISLIETIPRWMKMETMISNLFMPWIWTFQQTVKVFSKVKR